MGLLQRRSAAQRSWQAEAFHLPSAALCCLAPPWQVAPGHLADLLVVEGNPLEDISLLARPGESLRLIMKEGRVVRNTF